MADRKISDLTALTAPAAGDYLPIVDISEVSAANKNKRITIEELLRGAPDGTAAAPSIGFESDPNTGIYSPGADALGLVTGGTERARIDSDGRLLVGTSSGGSVARLQVQGSTLFNDAFVDICYNGSAASGIAADTSLGVLRFTDQASNANIFAQISCATDAAASSGDYPGRLVFSTTADGASSPTERLRITSAGLVGIGTTSPNGLLDVRSATTWIGDGATDAFLQFNQSATAANRWHIGAGSSNALIFYKGTYGSGSETARIDSSGRLLVGTSTARSNFFGAAPGVAPQIQLESGDTNGSSLSITRNSNDGDGPTLLFGRSRGTGNTVVQSGDRIGRIEFQANDATSFVRSALIESFVDGTPGTNDMPGRLVFSTTADGASSPTERMRIKSNGTINFSNVATYADNTAALAGGLVAGDVYRKSDGTLMITY